MPDDPSAVPPRRRFRFFAPILAGATWRDRVVACVGAVLGIGLTALVCTVALGHGTNLPLLVAPMGATAVLLFAVPASPLAQPWSIVGGNTLSALVGIAVARLVPDPLLAAGLAVGLAIGVMSLARCLHPPGGAAALVAVLGGPAVAAAGYSFALVPVAANAVLLTLLGYGFHKLARRHAYPHRAAAALAPAHGTGDPPPQVRVGFDEADIDAALADLGETFDIDRGDLDRLLRQVELRAVGRAHGEPTCAAIMSRDIVSVSPAADLATAQRLLLDHAVRSLPVVDAAGHVLGCVGLRELTRPGATVAEVMSPAWTAPPDRPVIALIAPLTDGKSHAAAIVDDEGRLLGMVTQTDLLATLGRVPAAARGPAQERGDAPGKRV